jgi:hypothetical protein
MAHPASETPALQRVAPAGAAHWRFGAAVQWLCWDVPIVAEGDSGGPTRGGSHGHGITWGTAPERQEHADDRSMGWEPPP